MRKDRPYCILYMAVLLTVSACGNGPVDRNTSEEFITEARALSFNAPDSAIQMLEHGLEQKYIDKDDCDYWHGAILMNSGRLREAGAVFETLMDRIDSEEGKTDLKMRVLRNLSYAGYGMEEYPEAIRYSIRGDSLAQAAGNRQMQASFSMALGMYTQHTNPDQAEHYILNALEIYRDMDGKDAAVSLTQAQEQLFLLYANTGDYDNAQEAAEQCLASARELEKIDEDCMFIADGAKYAVYAMQTLIYAQEGRREDARGAYDMMAATAKGKGQIGKLATVPQSIAIGRYTESLRILDSAKVSLMQSEDRNSSATNLSLQKLLRQELECHRGTGDEASAVQVERQLDSLVEALRTNEYNMKIESLSNAYQMQKKEFELKAANTRIRTGRITMAVLGVILLLVTALVVITLDYGRKMKHKNTVLTEYIDNSISNNVKEIADERNVEESRREDVERFKDALKCRSLCLEEEFDETQLLHELQIRKSNFRSDFKAVTGETLSQYLNTLRLDRTVELIRNHPEYTFEYIAGESGFNSRVTMYRAFTRKYGMSPREYRNNCGK